MPWDCFLIDRNAMECLNTNLRTNTRLRITIIMMSKPNTLPGLSVLLWILSAFCPPTLASERGINFISNATSNAANNTAKEHRLALVIGNSHYNHINPLSNPKNDAADMASALKRLGFEVIVHQNSTHQAMEQAVADFGQQLQQRKGVGLFYYAGHGIQADGKNYLLPIDANIRKPSDIKFEAMDAGLLLKELAFADNRLNMVILDACRDNPFAASFRSVSRGLAQIDAPFGTLLAYATAPGNVAADGTGRNGTYTEKLLTHLESPGLKVEELFKKVRQDVIRQTNRAQIPWESSSLVGDFYFVPLKIKTPVPTSQLSLQGQECQQPNIDKRPVSCLFNSQP
ncbi:MAG: putative caspase-like protein [Phenylobacterium sp.]|jgi:uncharacterized caspase-like protein